MDKDLTTWQKLRHWFWTSKAGMITNIIFGWPVIYRGRIENGVVVPYSRTIIRDLTLLRVGECVEL